MALFDGDTTPGALKAMVSGASPPTGQFAISGCTSLAAGSYWVGILSAAGIMIGQDEGNLVTRYRQDMVATLDPSASLTPDSPVSNLAVYAITVP
jgi:hypothetical protein